MANKPTSRNQNSSKMMELLPPAIGLQRDYAAIFLRSQWGKKYTVSLSQGSQVTQKPQDECLRRSSSGAAQQQVSTLATLLLRKENCYVTIFFCSFATCKGKAVQSAENIHHQVPLTLFIFRIYQCYAKITFLCQQQQLCILYYNSSNSFLYCISNQSCLNYNHLYTS